MSDFLKDYQANGYVVMPQQIPVEAVNGLLQNLCNLVKEVCGEEFTDANGPEIAAFFNKNRDVQSLVYDKIREPQWLESFSSISSLVQPIKQFLATPDISLFSKIPLRIDAPLETSEIAVWHQDFFYVKGNTDVVTAWIPLQDTYFQTGCLMVMPKSHELGPLPHDNTVLKKRHHPGNIFDREVRYVEMRKGDVLYFNACLLHSSGLNISDRCRYSVQARYTRTNDNTDPNMGRLIAV